jgi:hypothetical protein
MFTAVAPVRLVPIRVTGTVVLCVPVVGLIDVSVAPCTVNVTALLVPPGVVTVTLLAVSAAVLVTTQFAVTVVVVGVPVMVQVTPAPDAVTAVAPLRLVPVRVTGTVVPRTPEVGLMEVSVGAGGAAARNSTAPTSTALFVFLELPKKSKLGAAA